MTVHKRTASRLAASALLAVSLAAPATDFKVQGGPQPPADLGDGVRNLPDDLLTPEGRALKQQMLRGAQPRGPTALPGGGVPAGGPPPGPRDTSGSDSARSLLDTAEPIIPRSNRDLEAIKGHADAILALANQCTEFVCPVVKTCATALKLAQGLVDAESYLNEMLGALNRAAADSAQAHNNVVAQTRITSANLERAIRVLAIQEFLTKFASMMFDLASLAGDLESMLKEGSLAPGDNWAAKLDGLYETVKDAEAVIVDGVKVGVENSGGNPDNVKGPVGGATTGLGGMSEETANKLNDVKSSLSDAANAIDKVRDEMKKAKELGQKFNPKGEAGRGLAGAIGKIAFRELKAIADQQIAANKKYIEDLMKDLSAEERILGELFLQRMRIGERRNVAEDALRKVRLARAALVACLARTCGVPTMTRPSFPDYYAPPVGMSASALAKHFGWGTALRDLNVRVANTEITLRERFEVKDSCVTGGGGTVTDPGGGGGGAGGTAWGGQGYHRLKAACPECQPAADALSAILGEMIYIDRERNRILANLERQAQFKRELTQAELRLKEIDRHRSSLRETLSGLGRLIPGITQELALADARRVEIMGEISFLRREIERLEHERPLLIPLARRRTELAALEPAASEALRACEERFCTPIIVDTVFNRYGHNPFNPTDPIGRGGTPISGGAAGSFALSSATYSGGEGGAVLVMVSRSGGSAGIVSVGYATGAGSATPGADYVAATGRLRWENGETSTKSFTIALIDDTEVEGAESFFVTLDNAEGGAAVGVPSRATINIADNDSPAPPQPAGNLQFTSATYSVAENGSAVTITVTRTGGSNGQVTVQYFTGGGTGSATAGSDYQSSQGTLAWGNGDTSPKTFTVPIVNDTQVEGNETFQVALGSPSGGATLGAPAVAAVTITDDDVATGPCGAQGHAWQPNTGAAYSCGGSCSPSPSPQTVTVNGMIVTVSPFDAQGPATFNGCSATLTSDSSTLVYFSQANHRATITRTSNNTFSADIVSSGGGTCNFSCSRSGP